MLEKNKYTTEDINRFLDVLEAENEDALTRVMEQIQDVDQKVREVDYSLKELDQKPDSNMNFFSPVGVYEEGEEKRELLKTAEKLEEELPRLTERLEHYKHRRDQIYFLRERFLMQSKDSVRQNADEEQHIFDREQGIHILESHEYERNRIAGDLHDSSVQSLTGLVHKTELCMRLMDIDTVRVKLELQIMSETIKKIIDGMREIIYDLRPMSLDNLGLAVTIDAYCLQLKKTYDFEVNFYNRIGEPELSSICKVTLYRVIQEACRNVMKHAKATKLEITLSEEGKNLRMEIKDNGVGFDIEKNAAEVKEQLYKFGLPMMKERVTLLGGVFHINSVIGEGTTVCVKIPLQRMEGTDGNN